MNENISEYLLKYMKNPDPQYAVMIKGKWGCGKSFFIKNWLDNYKERYNTGKVALEPIYVSLYGLKEISQITEYYLEYIDIQFITSNNLFQETK
ncbi:MAG: hypothetical protein IJY75_09140 [Bacteroidaceae bacterium]|nr:hypothetical protein [Bacteroidaceae bacterium]